MTLNRNLKMSEIGKLTKEFDSPYGRRIKKCLATANSSVL